MHMFYYIIRQKWDEINRQMWEISAWGGVGVETYAILP